MNKYIIHCTTIWCGVYENYSALAYCESELDDTAQDLAYSLFYNADGWESVAEDRGYDPDNMTDEEWEDLYETTDESAYYGYEIELVDSQEKLEFWEECDLVYKSE